MLLLQDVEERMRLLCGGYHLAAIVGANSSRAFSNLVHNAFDSIAPRPMVGGGKTVRYPGKSRDQRVNGWHVYNATLRPMHDAPTTNDNSESEGEEGLDDEPAGEHTRPAESESSGSNKRDRDAQAQQGAPSNSDAEPSGKRPRQEAEEDEGEIEYADDDD